MYHWPLWRFCRSQFVHMRRCTHCDHLKQIWWSAQFQRIHHLPSDTQKIKFMRIFIDRAEVWLSYDNELDEKLGKWSIAEYDTALVVLPCTELGWKTLSNSNSFLPLGTLTQSTLGAVRGPILACFSEGRNGLTRQNTRMFPGIKRHQLMQSSIKHLIHSTNSKIHSLIIFKTLSLSLFINDTDSFYCWTHRQLEG